MSRLTVVLHVDVFSHLSIGHLTLIHQTFNNFDVTSFHFGNWCTDCNVITCGRISSLSFVHTYYPIQLTILKHSELRLFLWWAKTYTSLTWNQSSLELVQWFTGNLEYIIRRISFCATFQTVWNFIHTTVSQTEYEVSRWRMSCRIKYLFGERALSISRTHHHKWQRKRECWSKMEQNLLPFSWQVYYQAMEIVFSLLL